jgi:hypothetical protein
MSTSLPARAKALRERLVNLDQLGANVDEAGQLEDLRSDLALPAAEFSRVLQQRKMLADSGIDIAEPPSLEIARKRAAVLLEKFKAERKAATLKKGVGWASLLKDIKAASTDVSAIVDRSWKGHRQSIFTGEAPGVIKGRIALTPANEVSFKAYEQLYQAFRAEFDMLPKDKGAIVRVRNLAARLNETAKKFDFNAPPDVKRFLEAIQSGGAKLSLLTDEVFRWLEANTVLDSYRIVPWGPDGSR